LIILIIKVHKSNLEGLLQRHVEMAAEIKNLDTDLQMLVYENYNKFISATDTIKRYLDYKNFTGAVDAGIPVVLGAHFVYCMCMCMCCTEELLYFAFVEQDEK
jgi:hypothetical protein